MAEPEEETEDMSDEPEAPELPDEPGIVHYLVRSVIRGRSNRTARATQVGRRGFVQRIAGGTILVRRARPARITEAVLKANLAELKKAVLEHRVVVTTPAGQLVDLETFEVAPPVADKPLPNPPLDSAKNDKNEGIGYHVPPNPTGTPQNAEKPELLQRGSLLDEEDEPEPPTQPVILPGDATVQSEAATETPPPTAPAPAAPPKLVQHPKDKTGKGKRGSP